MATPEYAVVSYLGGALARFAEALRRELAPAQAHLRAHITLVHPRLLVEDFAEGAPATPPAGLRPGAAGQLQPGRQAEFERRARALVEQTCHQLAPVRLTLGAVESFLPRHPTLYLAVENGARHLRYLNGLLRSGPLGGAPRWDYVPHLTLATFAAAEEVAAAQPRVNARWQAYTGAREFIMDELTLVREESGSWLDLGSWGLAR